MNKAELIERIAIKADVSKATAGRMLDAALQSIMDVVAGGNQVALAGFGSFKPQTRPARMGRNPKTGEAIQIPSSVVPKFVPSSAFKASTNSD